MSEPRTEAGKALLLALDEGRPRTLGAAREAVLAIEAEAARPDPASEGLDAAWAEAEAALPDGACLRLTVGGDFAPERRAVALAFRATGTGIEVAAGPTPAAALRALLAALEGTKG